MSAVSAALLLVLLLPAAGHAQKPASSPAAPTPPASATLPAEPSSAADPLAAAKALVRRYIEDVLAAGRLELVDDYVAADYADRTPGADSDLAGPALVRRSQERLRERFRDVRYTLDQLVAEGNLVVARYVVQAVFQPKREGAPAPEPRDIAITGMTLFRVVDGKIRESWTINDQLEMFRQLGYELSPPKGQGGTPAQPAPPAHP